MNLRIPALVSILLSTTIFARNKPQASQTTFVFENSGQYSNSYLENEITQETEAASNSNALDTVEDFINNAKHSLTMELYELRHPRLKEAIINALNRGVRVRIVMEPDPVGAGCDGFSKVSSDSSTCEGSAEFSSRFIAASKNQRSSRFKKPSGLRFFNKNLCKNIDGGNEGFCFQHGKLMVRDHNSFIMSSGNFNESNLCSGENLEKNSCYRDISVIVNDVKAAKALDEIVELDYSVSSECNNELRFQTRFGFFRRASQSRCAENNMEVNVSEHNKKIVEIVERSSIDKYITINPVRNSSLSSFFRLAKKSIRIQTQYIKQQEWQEALLEAMQNKVKVYLTLPSFCHFIQKDYGVGFLEVGTVKGKYGSYSRWLEPYENSGKENFSLRIFNKGIPDLTGNPMGYQHAKIVIIDDKLAWVGSTNGSLTSTNFNREFGIIIEDPKIVSFLLNIVKTDHAMGLSIEQHIPNIHSLDYSIWLRTPGTCKLYDRSQLPNLKRKQQFEQSDSKRRKTS